MHDSCASVFDLVLVKKSFVTRTVTSPFSKRLQSSTNYSKPSSCWAGWNSIQFNVTYIDISWVETWTICTIIKLELRVQLYQRSGFVKLTSSGLRLMCKSFLKTCLQTETHGYYTCLSHLIWRDVGSVNLVVSKIVYVSTISVHQGGEKQLFCVWHKLKRKLFGDVLCGLTFTFIPN